MKSLEELRALREKMKSQTDNRSVASGDETVIKVGMATCGIAAGARPVLDASSPSSKCTKRGINTPMCT